MLRIARLLCVAGALLLPAKALARTPEPATPTWKWQRFRAWEYGFTGSALSVAFFLRFVASPPGADWSGGILFDDWVHEHTALESIPQRRRVKTMTDVFFFGSMAYRVVDSTILPLVVWRDSDLALQLSMIDLEAFGFVAITLWGGQALFGRERPYTERCGDARFAATEDGCPEDSSNHNRSFYAGHPAVATAAAGLTCTHHAHLALYGGAGDTLACGTMIGAAVMTGIGRVVTEEHHASDLLVGFGVGAFAGFALPELLHYRHVRGGSARPAREPTVTASLQPIVGEHQLGLALIGRL